MKAVALAAASFVAAMAITAAGNAQVPGVNTQTTPFGQTGDAAYPPPPGTPPAGSHYEWIFGYDRHGDYIGHWTLVRGD